MSFKDIEIELLRRQAIEDFAVDVHHRAGHAAVEKALAEAGVTWDIYLQRFPEAAGTEPDPAATVVENPGAEVTPVSSTDTNVITSADVTGATTKPVVRTKEAEAKVGTADLYLVKMNRENPYFEFRGEKLHKFTQENPFAIMSANDANRITGSEDGFSIATPAEAQSYYDHD